MKPIRAEIGDARIAIEQDGEWIFIEEIDPNVSLSLDEARALGLALLMMGSDPTKQLKLSKPLWLADEPEFYEAMMMADRDNIPERIKWIFKEKP